MSDIKLFTQTGETFSELPGSFALLESNLQKQIESNMLAFLGVHFLATEYTTGKSHKGRIDSLGLDENGCPVIIEYKRAKSDNVITQGLFYLDWLLDHQAEFQLLVMQQLGNDYSDSIEWSGTRLICIAADFNRYDEHAIQQINRNIELMRYRYFAADLLLLELVNAQSGAHPAQGQGQATQQPLKSPVHQSSTTNTSNIRKNVPDKTQAQRLLEAPVALLALFEELCAFTEQLGDEVQRKDLKRYTAFKRIKNFISIVILTGKKDPKLQVYLKLPSNMAEDNDFSRDVTGIGHWGTGDFEVNVRTLEDLDKTKQLITLSYERS